MRRALAPLLFDDEDLPAQRLRRDPVAPAEPSASAKRKKTARRTPDGLEVQSFQTLLAQLGTRCRNECRIKSDPHSPAFTEVTQATPLQDKALELLQGIVVPSNGK